MLRRKFFVFYAPTLQWYQSLDLFVEVGAIKTQGVVGVDVLVATSSRLFCILLDSLDCRRPGPTLLVIARETGSMTNMQLVLHKWLAGVSFSIYGEMRSTMGGLSKGYLNKRLSYHRCGFV